MQDWTPDCTDPERLHLITLRQKRPISRPRNMIMKIATLIAFLQLSAVAGFASTPSSFRGAVAHVSCSTNRLAVSPLMKATRKKGSGAKAKKAGTAAATIAKPTKSKAKSGASALKKAKTATASKAKQAKGKQANAKQAKRAVSTVPKKLVLLKKEGEATVQRRVDMQAAYEKATVLHSVMSSPFESVTASMERLDFAAKESAVEIRKAQKSLEPEDEAAASTAAAMEAIQKAQEALKALELAEAEAEAEIHEAALADAELEEALEAEEDALERAAEAFKIANDAGILLNDEADEANDEDEEDEEGEEGKEGEEGDQHDIEAHAEWRRIRPEEYTEDAEEEEVIKGDDEKRIVASDDQYEIEVHADALKVESAAEALPEMVPEADAEEEEAVPIPDPEEVALQLLMETLAAGKLFSNGNLAEAKPQQKKHYRNSAMPTPPQQPVNAAAAARNAFFNGKRAEAARPVESRSSPVASQYAKPLGDAPPYRNSAMPSSQPQYAKPLGDKPLYRNSAMPSSQPVVTRSLSRSRRGASTHNRNSATPQSTPKPHSKPTVDDSRPPQNPFDWATGSLKGSNGPNWP